jgi:hypothetical protein
MERMPAIERNALHTAAQPIEQINSEEREQLLLQQNQQKQEQKSEVVDLLGLGDILFGGEVNNNTLKDGGGHTTNGIFLKFIFFYADT